MQYLKRVTDLFVHIFSTRFYMSFKLLVSSVFWLLGWCFKIMIVKTITSTSVNTTW